MKSYETEPREIIDSSGEALVDIPGPVEKEQVVEEPLATGRYTRKEVVPAEEDSFA